MAAYARVSTDSDEQFTSFDSQCKVYEDYIKSKPDWEFVKVYADDGLVLDTDKMQFEDNQLEKYESELSNYVDVVDNQIVVDYESIEKLGDYSDTISLIRENAEFANSLAEEKPEIVTINDDLSLSFDIEDEYAEQWDAWKLSWSFWKGWSFKLDSDFGKLVGISGIVYNFISKISNGAAFYKKLLSITDKSYLASTLSTLFFYLPGAGVKDIIATYLRNYAGVIASGLVTINMMLMTLKCASLGTGWLIFKFVDILAQRFVPSLITSCSMVYNCFKYNAPIYCKANFWTLSIRYLLTKF